MEEEEGLNFKTLAQPSEKPLRRDEDNIFRQTLDDDRRRREEDEMLEPSIQAPVDRSKDILDKLNSPFITKMKTDEIYENLEAVLKYILLDVDIRQKEPLDNFYSLTANFIKLMVENKKANANYLLSIVIKYTSNYVGLLLIGLLMRNGANPNVYFERQGYGNIHVLCYVALRKQDREQDTMALQIMHLLVELGSDPYYPAYRYQDYDQGDIDLGFVSELVDNATKRNELNNLGPSQKLAKDFILEMGFDIGENTREWLNSKKNSDTIVNFIVASDNLPLFKNVMNREFFADIILKDELASAEFLFRLSTADSLGIASQLKKENFPFIDGIVNGQPIPLLVATSSCDKSMFDLFIRKGSLIKYPVINNIVVYYKWLKMSNIQLNKNNYFMLLDAINIGADIDLYQYELFVSAAEYDETEEIKKAFQVPKWKKLCSVPRKETRIELKQIAFDLNLNFNLSEEQICNKLQHISLLNKEDYIESAIKRQEDRINSKLSNNTDYIGEKKEARYRCSEKCTVITNPYLYNDARMAFYKDPKDGEVWCFTSDTFVNLLASKVNPYNNNPLPLNFIETLKAQVNILKELAIFNDNKNIKDAMKEYFERTDINNKKSTYAYNTVIKSLSLFGLSEERFNESSSNTLKDTILENICGVKISHFDIMNRKHQIMFTIRIIYSLLKNLEDNSELAKQIAEALGANIDENYTYGDEEDNTYAEVME